jgi:hypothetical protein
MYFTKYMTIKSNHTNAVFSSFNKKVVPVVIDFLANQFNNNSKFIENYKTVYDKSNEYVKDDSSISDKVKQHISFRSDLLKLIENESSVDWHNSFSRFIRDYEKVVKAEIANIPVKVNVKEVFNKYKIHRNDNPIVFVRKVFDNVKLSVGYLFKRSINPFRRLFRLKPLSLEFYRYRKVPLRNMVSYYLFNKFMDALQPMFINLLESRSQFLIDLWVLDDKADMLFQKFLKDGSEAVSREEAIGFFKSLLDRNQLLFKNFNNNISDVVSNLLQSFINEYAIVDTLDLTVKKYARRSNNKQYLKRIDSVNNEFLLWQNTFNALFDDWSVDAEISHLYYEVTNDYFTLNDEVKSFTDNFVTDSFLKIESFITQSSKKLSSHVLTKPQVADFLITERKSVTSHLAEKLIPRSVELLTGCYASDISSFVSNVEVRINSVSKNRAFVKNKNYIRGVSASEVNSVSPYDLVNFSALPSLKLGVYNLQKVVDKELELARVKLISLATVCDFSLESALLMLQNSDETTQSAVDNAKEGFSRAVNQLQQVKDSLIDTQTLIYKELRTGVVEFNIDIQKLKNTENILALNIKIARIQALARSNEIQKQIIEAVKISVPKVIKVVKDAHQAVLVKIKQVRSNLGLEHEKTIVSFELSEFIIQTTEALKKLPFIYQRLYQISPTDEERFFVNRNHELALLNTSFENWQKDRFVTVAVIGEKGSGTSSLINYFLKRSSTNLAVIKKTIDGKIISQEQYYQLFSSILNDEVFDSNDAIIDYLNNSSQQRMIVLENLQHMFLKMVNGFDNMNMLFEVMANTMKKVLWIGVYTNHSWSYLNKTIHVGNYFTDEIFIRPLDSKVIEDIVFKRNRLSGYQINFAEGSLVAKSKSYNKLDDASKQSFLRDLYFKNLGIVSHGNISLAQLYWLRSTINVTENAIEIGEIKIPDFSFVKNLSADELFSLQTIVLHDGLCLQDFAPVMGKSIKACRNILVPMLEKGFLIRPRNKYNVNPVIFKPVVDYLASRNFIN